MNNDEKSEISKKFMTPLQEFKAQLKDTLDDCRGIIIPFYIECSFVYYKY